MKSFMQKYYGSQSLIIFSQMPMADSMRIAYINSTLLLDYMDAVSTLRLITAPRAWQNIFCPAHDPGNRLSGLNLKNLISNQPHF